MTKKVWNLMYAMGNTNRIIGSSDNPQTRKLALEGAAVVQTNGWRVWVEHHVSGERIFESERERLHREGTAAPAEVETTSVAEAAPPANAASDQEVLTQMRHLANVLAQQRGSPLAVVLVEPTAPDYANVAPQFVMEDAFCSGTGRWPIGFSLTLLNTST